MRAKISRKECKESVYWLRIINETNTLKNNKEAERLIEEGTEIKKILSSIINNSGG